MLKFIHCLPVVFNIVINYIVTKCSIMLFIFQSSNSAEVLDSIKNTLSAKKVNETISRIAAVKGLLSLQLQVFINH